MAQKSRLKNPCSKIDFSQVLRNFAGLPMKEGEEVITLKHVAVATLISPQADEQISGVEKFARYQIAKRIHQGDTAFEKQEIEKIKTLIGKTFVPMIVGASFDALDGTAPSNPADSSTEATK